MVEFLSLFGSFFDDFLDFFLLLRLGELRDSESIGVMFSSIRILVSISAAITSSAMVTLLLCFLVLDYDFLELFDLFEVFDLADPLLEFLLRVGEAAMDALFTFNPDVILSLLGTIALIEEVLDREGDFSFIVLVFLNAFYLSLAILEKLLTEIVPLLPTV